MISRIFARLNRSLVAPSMVLIAAGCVGGPARDVEPADLVLRGGRIVTADAGHPEAKALAARDGRIVALGTADEIAPFIGEGTEVLELGGALAIPGFIEGHGHFLGLGDAALQLDLRSAKSFDEILLRVEEAVVSTPPGEWIRGRGWHQEKWDRSPEPQVEGFPVHGALSVIAPDHPVALTHASGHAVFVNAMAMELAGIDRSTPDPPGGEILRDAKGDATGLLRESAENLVAAALVAAGDSLVKRRVELASLECLRNGITSFQDAGSPFSDVDALQRAAHEGDLAVRLWVMVRDSNEALAEKLASYKSVGEADDMLSVAAIKLSIDGALGSRGAWLLEPYSDSLESTGLNLIPLAEAQRTAELAIEHGVQLCIHAIGDRANREVLDLYATTFAAHPDKSDLRWRVEHAQHLHPDDLPRFAELGIIASMQAVHCTSDGPWVPDRLGEERSASGAYLWRRLIDSGAVVSNGTDAPVEDVDPIANFYATVTRRMGNGEVFYPDERLTRMEALESQTIKAAYAAFEEDRKGSLAPGKLADMTVLSRDILTIPEEEILDAEVLYTIVGGRVVYRRGGVPAR